MAKSTTNSDSGNVENAFRVLSGIQDQIRFADAKAAFIFAINTLMCGFVARTGDALQRGLGSQHVSRWAIVSLVALIVFALAALVAIGCLMFAVFPRLGEKAPQCRVFFGHIVKEYGRDYGKYTANLKGMLPDDWLEEVGGQIVETSNIAEKKHRSVGYAVQATMVGLAAWVVAVFSSMLIPT
jgi:hypothetical protein